MDNSTALSFVYVLNCVEFLPITLLAFVSIFNGWMIVKSAILHVNLKAILLVQSSLIFAYSCYRIPNLLWRFTHNLHSIPSKSLDHFVIVMITEANLIGHIMIVERIMATLFVRKYEQWKAPWFTLSWMSLMILFAILIYMIPSFGVSRELGFAVIFTHVVFIFSIVELIAFAILNLYNRKRYEHFNDIRSDITHKYKLSERYQLHQNIYSGQQLGPSFCFHLINIICSNAVCIMAVYLRVQYPIYDLYIAYIYFVHTLSKLGIEITVITFHPVMRRKMLAIWKNFLRIFNCRNASTVQQNAFFHVNKLDNGHTSESVAFGQLRENRSNINREINEFKHQQQENQQTKHFKILDHYWQ